MVWVHPARIVTQNNLLCHSLLFDTRPVFPARNRRYHEIRQTGLATGKFSNLYSLLLLSKFVPFSPDKRNSEREPSVIRIKYRWVWSLKIPVLLGAIHTPH
jgi:hypothetical protein